MTETELTALQHRLTDKDRRIREDRKALDDERAAFSKEMEGNREILERMERLKLEMETLSSRMQPSDPITRAPANDTIDTIPFRDAVPVYSGTNMSALSFARACRTALEMIHPDTEPSFVRNIRGKLRGAAAKAIEGKYYSTLSELCARLIKIFDPPRDVDILRGELATIRQREREHVLDYISRVKDLMSAIIEYGNSDATEIEDLALTRFIRGVDPPIRAELRRLVPRDIYDAFDLAVDVAKEIDEDEEYYRRKWDTRYRNARFREGRIDRPTPPREQPTPVRTAPRPEEPATRGRFCNFCKRRGHDIHECRRRAAHNQQQGNGATLPPNANSRREEPAPTRGVRVAEIPDNAPVTTPAE